MIVISDGLKVGRVHGAITVEVGGRISFCHRLKLVEPNAVKVEQVHNAVAGGVTWQDVKGALIISGHTKATSVGNVIGRNGKGVITRSKVKCAQVERGSAGDRVL